MEFETIEPFETEQISLEEFQLAFYTQVDENHPRYCEVCYEITESVLSETTAYETEIEYELGTAENPIVID